MYRKPGSSMTAVEIVSSMYDGPIPADVMMQAHAEDSAFRADPMKFAADEALASVAWNTRCARECIALIRKLIAEGQDRYAQIERDHTLRIHLAARRTFQAEVRKLTQQVA